MHDGAKRAVAFEVQDVDAVAVNPSPDWQKAPWGRIPKFAPRLAEPSLPKRADRRCMARAQPEKQSVTQR